MGVYSAVRVWPLCILRFALHKAQSARRLYMCSTCRSIKEKCIRGNKCTDRSIQNHYNCCLLSSRKSWNYFKMSNNKINELWSTFRVQPKIACILGCTSSCFALVDIKIKFYNNKAINDIFETKRSLECPQKTSKYHELKSSFLIGQLWYVSDLQEGLSDLQDGYKNGNFKLFDNSRQTDI